MPSEPPDPIPADLIISDDTVPPGAYWSRVLPRWVTVRVADVEAACQRLLAAGVRFAHGPQPVFWGYGAELFDPNGYVLRLWDEASMKAKGGG